MIYCLPIEKIITAVITAVIITLIVQTQPSHANDKVVCEQIGREVEVKHKLPKHILTSISLVEAGRRHNDGSVKSWPWSLNHAGKSVFFERKAQALDYLEKNITSEFKNIDVGCMQINVRWHRENFESLDEMIDPQKNIEYAAQFLTNLKNGHGSWEEAIKHYHSSTPKLNVKYYAKVHKAWSQKTDNNSLVQTAAISLNQEIMYPRSKLLELDYKNFDPYQNISIDENKHQRLKLGKAANKNIQNTRYLNAVLRENSKADDKEELKRYIKYKSAFLGQKIDMILLFREEFSKN